jgi:hypothetical protein
VVLLSQKDLLVKASAGLYGGCVHCRCGETTGNLVKAMEAAQNRKNERCRQTPLVSIQPALVAGGQRCGCSIDVPMYQNIIFVQGVS